MEAPEEKNKSPIKEPTEKYTSGFVSLINKYIEDGSLPKDFWELEGRLEEELYDPDDHVLDYMKSSEWKAGMPDGPKDDDTSPVIKYQRGGIYTGGGMGFGGMYEGEEVDKINLFEKVTKDSVICDNCSWEWKIKDGGDDLYICHKCDHDNTPKLNEYGFEVITKNWWKDQINKNIID